MAEHNLQVYFFSPHSSFINSALGADPACGELQMCVGDKAGSVLLTPVLIMLEVQLQEAVLPLLGMMGDSPEGKEEVGI